MTKDEEISVSKKAQKLIQEVNGTWYDPQYSQELHSKAQMGILRNQGLLRDLLMHILKTLERYEHDER